jgi:membrane associated rhomboid family serine protease
MLPDAALLGGFFPARLGGLTLPNDHGMAVPAWLTPLSATLIHGGIGHLLLNLLILVYCGLLAERAIGSRAFTLLYVVGAYAAAAGQWAIGGGGPMIGASGAISAVVAVYALLYGRGRARKMGPLSANLVHALWLAAAWIAIQLLVGVTGMEGATVAIGAHIGGFVAGLALARPLLAWRYRRA